MSSEPPQAPAAPELAPPPRRRVVRWLDRHAHRDSRTRHYLELLQVIVALFGLGGLIALVWQVQQANVAARRAAYDQVVDSVTDLTLLQIEYPDLVCVLYPDASFAMPRLDREHEVALQFLLLSTNAHERFWRLHRDGLLNAEDWLAQDRWFREGIVGAAPYPALWPTNRQFHAAGFTAYVDELVATEEARRTLSANGPPPTAGAAAAGTPAAC